MTLNCNGTLIDLQTPKIMGILNITPDSFYDGGRYVSEGHWLSRTETMLKEGATFIDIGGQSSRPGATPLNTEEELTRVVPVVQGILERFPNTLLSIDTYHSKVAETCVDIGACMVNDISAGSMDGDMMSTVARLGVPYVMMHMQGTPKDMQEGPRYDDVVKDVLYHLSGKGAEAKELGINDILIDPGFGFGKTLSHNYSLLAHLELFKAFRMPLLVGISRKSMIYKPLDITPQEALNGTTALHTIALQKGANILRVHDVKEAVECIKLHTLVKNSTYG